MPWVGKEDDGQDLGWGISPRFCLVCVGDMCLGGCLCENDIFYPIAFGTFVELLDECSALQRELAAQYCRR